MARVQSAALSGSAGSVMSHSRDTDTALQLGAPEPEQLPTAREPTPRKGMMTSQRVSSRSQEFNTAISTEVVSATSSSDLKNTATSLENGIEDNDRPESARVTKRAPDSTQPSPSAVDSGGSGIMPVHSSHPDSSPRTQTNTSHASSRIVSRHELDHGAPTPPTAPTETEVVLRPSYAAMAAQRRRNYASTNALTDYEADLTSRDRAKQKEAVKRYLGERVKEDWMFAWPQLDSSSSGGLTPPSLHMPDSPVSPTSEEAQGYEERWKERDEWLSDASESGEDDPTVTATRSPDKPSASYNIYQFESPDSVGDSIQRTQQIRKNRRKRRLAEEMAWNKGLHCFSVRRDVWTGARRVRKLGAPGLGSQPGSHPTGVSSTAVEAAEEDEEWEDEIEIPITVPILPAENAMRASIVPGAYHTIYDKVIVQQLTPSCPINLKDITRSCVQGWKRDGEWPPKATAPEPKRRSRKMSVASLFGLERQKTAEEKRGKPSAREEKSELQETKKKSGGFKKGLQRMLSLGPKEHKDNDTAIGNENGSNTVGS